MQNVKYSKREALKLLGLAGFGLVTYPVSMSFKSKEHMISRVIPSSGESLPAVGLGTWQTFDVGSSEAKREVLREVLIKMREYGSTVIDTSPMYGTSEKVVGDLTGSLAFQNSFFYATKVWTPGMKSGITQMERSFERMQRSKMDLIQIHNLVDWQVHTKTLKTWKEQGKIRYWGITHYLDSSHSSLEKIIKAEKPDFVQFNYSIRSRNAERSLFKTIKEHGTAVIINQPYESGSLFGLVKGKSLPKWSKDYGIDSWGQYFLKFILANELVTCVIPGTSKPHHMVDNAKAGFGSIVDEKGREKMYNYLKNM